MKFICKTENETKNLAKTFARSLVGGEIILARGTLGAGKTAFGQGLALGLGVKNNVNSPTFNIMKVYQGKKLNFYHIDAYRLEGEDAVTDIGLDEVLGNENGVSYIEWPNYIDFLLKEYKNLILVNIVINDDESREITLEEIHE